MNEPLIALAVLVIFLAGTLFWELAGPGIKRSIYPPWKWWRASMNYST